METVPDGAFRTIIADPPWSYANYRETRHGAAAAHYDGMTPEEIAAIPVNRWAGRDAVLLLWGTWPLLGDAIDVMRAWGFRQVTAVPWVKTSPSSGLIRTGVGIWFQACSEVLIVGVKGKSGRVKGKSVRGLLCGADVQFYAPIGKHSEKPEELRSWANRALPGPRLELFATAQRPGWTCIGRALGHELGANGISPFVLEPGPRHGAQRSE